MQVLQVLIDTQIFSGQRYGGISRYFTELIRHLPEQGVECIVPLRATDNAYIRQLPTFAHLPVLRWVPDHRRFCSFINGRADRAAMRRNDIDLVHPTGTDPTMLRFARRPYVCTVHDLILERFPHTMGDADRVKRHIEQKQCVIAGAKRIIAISEHTRRDLLDFYDIDPASIDVIHHGVDVPPAPSAPPSWAPRRYFLFVGQRGGYKNFKLLARAFGRVAAAHADVWLVCTGSPLTPAELKDVPPHVAGRIMARYVAPEQLDGLYAGALALVAPSRYEGFGMPLLEAGAQRCAVALSNCSCFPEVAADAGIYFDAENSEQLEAILIRLITDEAFRAERAAAMFARASQFSWEQTAALTAQCYAKALREI